MQKGLAKQAGQPAEGALDRFFRRGRNGLVGKFGTAFLAPYMTPGMLSDFTACGGVIFVATGLRMCGIKIFPVINMLPSMLIIMPLSALWARYVG